MVTVFFFLYFFRPLVLTVNTVEKRNLRCDFMFKFNSLPSIYGFLHISWNVSCMIMLTLCWYQTKVLWWLHKNQKLYIFYRFWIEMKRQKIQKHAIVSHEIRQKFVAFAQMHINYNIFFSFSSSHSFAMAFFHFYFVMWIIDGDRQHEAYSAAICMVLLLPFYQSVFYH